VIASQLRKVKTFAVAEDPNLEETVVCELRKSQDSRWLRRDESIYKHRRQNEKQRGRPIDEGTAARNLRRARVAEGVL
jgi:hypothetical protein